MPDSELEPLDVYQLIHRARGQIGRSPHGMLVRRIRQMKPAPTPWISSKISKAHRRRIRKQLQNAFWPREQHMRKALERAALMKLGFTKLRMLESQAEDPVYERPQRAERNGIRRYQKRVRGRVQSLPRPRPPKRERTAL